MKKTYGSLLVVAGLASAVLAGGNFAKAQEPGARQAQQGEFRKSQEGRGEHGRHFLNRLSEKLNLSEQQKAQVESVFKKRQAQVKPMKEALGAERKKLRTLVMSGEADEQAIRAQSAKVAAIQADLAVQKAQGAKELRGLLTPEQQAKFKTLQGEWEQKMKMKKGGHHRRCDAF